MMNTPRLNILLSGALSLGLAIAAPGCSPSTPPADATPTQGSATATPEPPTATATPEGTPSPGVATPTATATLTPTSTPTPGGAITPTPTAASTEPPPETPIPVDVIDETPIVLGGDDGISPRPRRRMDIDQLNATLLRLTGGITWIEGGVNLFEELEGTLGKPDYIESTSEDLTPSLIFQKFLGDGARSICAQLVARESAGGAPRVLMTTVGPEDTVASNAAGVEANIRALLLRFHGRAVPEGDSSLANWRWLFESAVHLDPDSSPLVGWQAVCVATLTHPDFYTY